MDLSLTIFIDMAELLAGLGDGSAAGAAVEWHLIPERLSAAAAGALSLSHAEVRLADTRIYVLSAEAEAGRAGGAVAEWEKALGVTVVRVKPRATLKECLACDLARTPRCHHCRNVGTPAGMLADPASSAVAADIFRLAREGGLDVAVLVSADRALSTVVRFLEGRRTRVVVAGVSPGARDLGTTASAVVDLATVWF
jgi:hypothetical protein